MAGRLARHEGIALAAGLGLALLIRVILLPRPGLAGDVEDFLAWAQGIQANGLGHAYDQAISFPPVLPWIWWALGLVWEPLGRATPDDPFALSLMKFPAVLADLGLAAIVGASLRARPGVAIAAALAILLNPVVWYLSAWWAQFESLYVLPMLVAWALVIRGRPGWAAVAIAIGLMTKPQALPLVIPFGAYYLRRFGMGQSIRAGLIAAATAAVLWAPFVAAGGPGNYLRNFADYASLFNALSVRAWNPWWIMMDVASGGGFIVDDAPILGPAPFRWLGYGFAGVLEALVFVWVWRRPTPTGLAWGLAAAALAAFVGLTQMHERYAYAAVVFLVLCWPDRLAIGTWLLLSAAITLNLLAAVPPSGGPGSLVPMGGGVGIAGSLAMTAGFAAAAWGLRRRVPGDERRLGG